MSGADVNAIADTLVIARRNLLGIRASRTC